MELDPAGVLEGDRSVVDDRGVRRVEGRVEVEAEAARVDALGIDLRPRRDPRRFRRGADAELTQPLLQMVEAIDAPVPLAAIEEGRARVVLELRSACGPALERRLEIIDTRAALGERSEARGVSGPEGLGDLRDAVDRRRVVRPRERAPGERIRPRLEALVEAGDLPRRALLGRRR